MAEARSNLRATPIFCHRCGERCGTEWVGEGFQWRDGAGDLYVDTRGNWHCSQACLDICGREPSARRRWWIAVLVAALLLALDLILLRACAH